MNHINEHEFLLFRDYINDICGIDLPVEKAYLIEARLATLMIECGCETFGEFYEYIMQNQFQNNLRQRIINAITTNETLWFRDMTPWTVLENIYLPKMIESILSGEKSRIRIWFTAVSTGQEAYSTAMCIDNYLKTHFIKGVSLSDFELIATDISKNVINIASKGIYDKISITRGLNDYYKNAYFKETGNAWVIDPQIKDAVTFQTFNLKDDYEPFGLFDIIFCRYVLIYFSFDLKKEIIDKMRMSLTNEGVLFTGNYILYELFQEGFHINHYENLTYFSKRDNMTD